MFASSKSSLLVLGTLVALTAPAEGQETLFSQTIGLGDEWLVFVHGGMTDHLDWGSPDRSALR